MKCKFLLSTSLIALSLTSVAQNAAKTFVITGDVNGSFNWRNIRQVDISNGKTAKTLLSTDTKWQMNGTSSDAFKGQLNSFPTATMVAAAAYDKKHDKLFFAPMRINEIRWMDVSAKGESSQFYSVENTALRGLDLNDEANHITRMDIAADGNGYAITNDANHLIKFTTGKKTVITDLGNIVDAESNKGVSIHNKCTSWGGDMIADAYGKLYIISANHNVFSLDIDSRIATHLGTIGGLPANFSTNGAAVDDDGNIVVSSATSYDGFYKFNLKDLTATPVAGSEKFNGSDLANSNLLLQKEKDAADKFTPIVTPVVVATDAKVYPNPVTGNEFNVLLDNQKAGNYIVILSDLSGRNILSKEVNVFAKSQVANVKIAGTLAKGMYFVKVVDANKQVVLSEKIVVQ